MRQRVPYPFLYLPPQPSDADRRVKKLEEENARLNNGRGHCSVCFQVWCVLYCIVLYLLRLPLQHKAGVNGGPRLV